jgi:hypothetical protein
MRGWNYQRELVAKGTRQQNQTSKEERDDA